MNPAEEFKDVYEPTIFNESQIERKSKSGKTFNMTLIDSAGEFKQVTRGHDIVVDGWAGAPYPHPYPMPLSHTQKKTSKTLIFALFDSCPWIDRRTNGPMDGQSLL